MWLIKPHAQKILTAAFNIEVDYNQTVYKKKHFILAFDLSNFIENLIKGM